VTTAPNAATPPPGTSAAKGKPLAIICGGGDFPIVLAESAAKIGRVPFLVGVIGSADVRIEDFAHLWLRLTEISRFFAAMRERGIEEIAMVGAIKRPEFTDLRFDLRAAKALPTLAALFRGGDNKLLAGVARLMERQGFKVVAAHEIAPQLLAPAGALTRNSPTSQALEDGRLGGALITALSSFDVGQAVIVAKRRVLAIEAAEGTDAALARVAEMRGSGRLRLKGRAGVLVKAPKRDQDMRIDLPAIGLATVRAAREAQLEGIVLAARRTLLIDREACARAADEAGIFLFGMDL
jgi:UDP-2,3-diacylglucosamine hydrolase